jgi:hypothetical protein
MSRGILVAGNDSALLRAVEAEAANCAERYAIASIANRYSRSRDGSGAASHPPTAAMEKARVSLDWNPRSAVSARALALAAENRLGQIDEAVLVCAPPEVPGAAADLRPVDVEVLANDHIKSWFFLAKELTAVFKARGQGALSLVYPEAAPDILGSAAVAAFRALSLALLSSGSAGEAYTVQGFTGGEAGAEPAFAAFIFKQLNDPKRWINGKLHKYSKPGLFR